MQMKLAQCIYVQLVKKLKNVIITWSAGKVFKECDNAPGQQVRCLDLWRVTRYHIPVDRFSALFTPILL